MARDYGAHRAGEQVGERAVGSAAASCPTAAERRAPAARCIREDAPMPASGCFPATRSSCFADEAENYLLNVTAPEPRVVRHVAHGRAGRRAAATAWCWSPSATARRRRMMDGERAGRRRAAARRHLASG
ncbi:MAG: hypothetical protein MZW92_49755 [Comamonadaceae bacterium]|nr:hypothetical protein [Comamonadaceae bacterium]